MFSLILGKKFIIPVIYDDDLTDAFFRTAHKFLSIDPPKLLILALERRYRKYPHIMRTISTKILTSKLGVRIVCEYVEKYHICGLKVGVRIICGYLW